MARLAHMSVRTYERKFRNDFHLTPQKYLRRLRIRMASRALVYTRQSLAEVAIGCGSSDQSHFTREFRRQLGRTPRVYREHYARMAALPLLFQVLPLSSKNSPTGSRYSLTLQGLLIFLRPIPGTA
jgi:AraC-like DNA-binding protein